MGLCLFWRELEESPFQKGALRPCCPTSKFCSLSWVVCGRPSRPFPSLGARLCCTWALAGVPATPTSLRAHTCSLRVSTPEPVTEPLPAQAVAQAVAQVGLPLRPPLCLQLCPGLGQELSGRGRAFPLWLGFSLFVGVRQRGGAGKTHWKTGQVEGWGLPALLQHVWGCDQGGRDVPDPGSNVAFLPRHPELLATSACTTLSLNKRGNT